MSYTLSASMRFFIRHAMPLIDAALTGDDSFICWLESLFLPRWPSTSRDARLGLAALRHGLMMRLGADDGLAFITREFMPRPSAQ